MRANGEIEFDGGFQNESETVQQILGVKLAHDVSEDLELSLAVGQSKDESDDSKDGVPQSRFDTKRDSATLQSNLMLSNTPR